MSGDKMALAENLIKEILTILALHFMLRRLESVRLDIRWRRAK
jgi:hypothetical protein